MLSVGSVIRSCARALTPRAVESTIRSEEETVDIAAIRNRMRSLRFWRRKDPFLELLESAPLDDEPVTEDDLRSLEEGRAANRAGRTTASEEVKRRYRERLGEATSP